MKALTISQPFATLIATGQKWVENRTWETKYRGPLAIHAGKGTQYMTRREMDEQELPYGSVVAVANLVACVELSMVRRVLFPTEFRKAGIDRQQFLEHKHTEGPWCWVLMLASRFEKPVAARGAQGLWNWEPPTGKGG